MSVKLAKKKSERITADCVYGAPMYLSQTHVPDDVQPFIKDGNPYRRQYKTLPPISCCAGNQVW